VLSKSYVAQAIAHETLRLQPVAPAIWRKAAKDVDLKAGFHIPEGTPIWVVLRKEIRDSHAGFDNFNPDQWLDYADDAGDISTSTPVAFNPDKAQISSLAFGLGARRCIGEDLAKAELIGLVAMLARRVKEVHMSPEELADKTPSFSEHPTGMPVTMSLRRA
jgi:cytochrome P450